MVCSILFALVAILPSLLAVHGAVVQRDGTFTYLTPQPTTLGQTASTTSTTPSSSQWKTTSTNATVPTSTQFSPSLPVSPSTTSSTYPTNSSSSTTTSSYPTTTPTSSYPTTTPTSSYPITTPTSSYPPITSTSSTVLPPPPSKTETYTPKPPPTTCQYPPPTPTPSGTANCNGVQQWQADFAYSAGNQAIYNNGLYTAIQWTYDNAPVAHPDQWSFGGTCAQPINNQANCNGVAAWQQATAYTSGSRVTYNGHLWSAVQWTQSNAPGDTSGSWKDLGACAW